ncbi:MAG: DUF4199 domain-containing protein [Allosphingosinicella sp.]
MLRIMLIYGALAGAIAIAVMSLNVSQGVHSLLVGYLVLFAALSLIFVSIKRYRDEALGGVIRFSTAALFGLGVAAVASLVYCLGWELFLWSTDYRFFEEYMAADLEAKRAAGATAAELAQIRAEVAPMIDQYNGQPLFRFAFTLIEILPVGIIVALISAALLRNSDFLPARARRQAS